MFTDLMIRPPDQNAGQHLRVDGYFFGVLHDCPYQRRLEPIAGCRIRNYRLYIGEACARLVALAMRDLRLSRSLCSYWLFSSRPIDRYT